MAQGSDAYAVQPCQGAANPEDEYEAAFLTIENTFAAKDDEACKKAKMTAKR